MTVITADPAFPAEKALPSCNIEAEQAVLGAVLTQNRALSHVSGLTAADFYEPLHQRIFSIAAERIANGELVDPIILKSIFDKDPALCDIGGGAYLAKLAAAAVRVIDIGAYAGEVKRHAVIRALQTALNLAGAELEAGDAHPHDIAATLAKDLAGITESESQHRSMTDYEVAISIVEGFKHGAPAVSTGLPKLDTAMGGGMYPGKAYGIAAEQKVGKTIMAGTISYNLARSGVKHLFVCGEMSPYEVHQRHMARELGVYPSAFRTRSKDQASFQSRVAEVALRSKRLIQYQNAPGLTFDQLQMYVANAVNNHGISGFIVDYWQLVGGKAKNQSTAEHLDMVAQWIATACRKYNVWALVAAQINKEGTTRGSQGLRQAFDQVYRIHCDETEANGRWLEMMDTRYTASINIGAEKTPGLWLREKGLFFEEVA